MKLPEKMPSLVYADSEGRIYDLPGLKMAGRNGRVLHPVDLKDLIPLPQGSELFVLPDRLPVGWDQDRDDMVVLDKDPADAKGNVGAVAAFMAPAYTQTALAAFYRSGLDIPVLPLFTYTAVGWWKGRFWAAGFRSDPDTRQDFCNFRPEEVRKKTIAMLKKKKGNRLIQHLGKCSLTYGCPAAKNLFMGRWEAPLPTSPICNAACLGCISLQSEGVPPASQDRITFVPATEEVADVAIPHLKRAKRPVVSFGQGCEGEPLLQAKLLERSIIKIREETNKGTINLNTNASLPGKVQSLIYAGLDSMRISINSTRKKYYHSYFRPKGYDQTDVMASWRIMKEAGRFVSLNLFVLPGLTDEMAEIERLSDLIEELGLDLIQLRNHNIDPDWYLDGIDYKYTGQRTGIKGMITILKKRFPKLRFGYFNPYLRSD
nr:radical SAM protein [Deltaproteobacteria bacterium]